MPASTWDVIQSQPGEHETEISPVAVFKSPLGHTNRGNFPHNRHRLNTRAGSPPGCRGLFPAGRQP